MATRKRSTPLARTTNAAPGSDDEEDTGDGSGNKPMMASSVPIRTSSADEVDDVDVDGIDDVVDDVDDDHQSSARSTLAASCCAALKCSEAERAATTTTTSECDSACARPMHLRALICGAGGAGWSSVVIASCVSF